MMVRVEELAQASRAAMERAYAPYSGFKVGAAVLAASGRVYIGCNVENSSYGLSICAERAAIFRAVSEGDCEVIALAICTSSGKAFPCGACRQVISEFARDGLTVEIYLVSDQGVEKYSLGELFPHPFQF